MDTVLEQSHAQVAPANKRENGPYNYAYYSSLGYYDGAGSTTTSTHTMEAGFGYARTGDSYDADVASERYGHEYTNYTTGSGANTSGTGSGAGPNVGPNTVAAAGAGQGINLATAAGNAFGLNADSYPDNSGAAIYGHTSHSNNNTTTNVDSNMSSYGSSANIYPVNGAGTNGNSNTAPTGAYGVPTYAMGESNYPKHLPADIPTDLGSLATPTYNNYPGAYANFVQGEFPPPASLTVDYDGLDLNDEIFFSHAAYTTAGEPDPLLLTLLLPEVHYGALQSALATPLASPPKLDARHRRRFSLAVDQLNRMTLTRLLPLPLPEFAPEPVAERTINPRQLLPHAPSRYILPLLVLSPALLTFFARDMPDDDADLAKYVMNDECVSAITYWLNNTANVILEQADGQVMRNPTGVIKPAWKRRNLIQVIPTGDVSPRQKRKRQRSITTAIPEDMATEPLSEEAEPATSQPAPSFSASFEAPSLPPSETTYAQLLGETRALQPSAVGDDDEPKPFPCPECDKQFKRLEHLKRHIRSVHSNIRPFHCKYCEKKFLRSDNLAQHSKTHFKLNANGTTTIIYGNPNPHNRGGRKKSIDESGMYEAD